MSKQVVLITGATAGIGRHVALHLAARGHRVIATGRRASALVALEREARERGTTIETAVLDVTDEASIEAARVEIERLTDGHGLDVLVNNAGYGLAAPVVEATDADLRAQFDTNVFGLMAVTRAFAPSMMARGRGRILNVSSIGGRVTFPMMGVYHASKYALEALSDALRMELAPFGLDVVLIEPGPIKSEFTERMNQSADPYKNGDSLYQPIFARAEEIERRTMAMATGPEPIARAIAHAIESRRPRARYVAPRSSRFMLAFLRALPTRLADAIKRRVFGLDRARLASPHHQEPRLAREAA
ncbi:MAG TPA: SDR family oxidoreductase [Polyangiaceae bacterium]|jgi:short-subunit dehydrogenase|nr:SDR family oxidoreductase [Polyangiaceae bacterium]